MKSIRLSLVVYFLLLLGGALGAVSLFSYQNSQQALRDKEASSRKFLESQLDNQKKFLESQLDNQEKFLESQLEKKRKTERTQFDRDLLARAQELANTAVWIHHQPEPLFALGLIGVDHFPQMLPWLAQSGHGPTIWKIHGMLPNIRIDEELGMVEEGQYFQTYGFQGQNLERSETLETWLSLPEEIRRKAEIQDVFDDVELKPGIKVRRVTIRERVKGTHSALVLPWPRMGKGKFGPQPGPGPSKFGGFRPSVFLQFAIETSRLDKSLAALEQSHRRDLDHLESEHHKELADLENESNMALALANLENETRQALAGLRTRLLWISFGTFAALIAGGWLLVMLGLSPLHRLSEAVRQVSPKDFRLPVDPSKLPIELQPIALRLAETLEQLKSAFSREKQAAADISHELRTPLATLLTTLEVALNKPRSPEEYREILEDCKQAGLQMNHLVVRLLALARLDAGADPFRPREVDVAYLAKQCADLVRPLALARGLDLRVHAPNPATLLADPDKIREVLTNLLHNAIEYNRPQGSIDLAVERNNGSLCMEVRDTGIGIAPEMRAHIFERFFRVDPSRNDGLHAGLGLAIVKGYIDLMGGSIAVDSNEKGSTFRVKLPAK